MKIGNARPSAGRKSSTPVTTQGRQNSPVQPTRSFAMSCLPPSAPSRLTGDARECLLRVFCTVFFNSFAVSFSVFDSTALINTHSSVPGPAVINTHRCAARRVFASSLSTGPPRDHGALPCHWTAIATKPIGQCVPFQTRGILQGPEEQSRPRGGKSIGVSDQPEYPRL